MAAMVELIGWKMAKAYDNDEFASIGLVKRSVGRMVKGTTDTILEYLEGI